MRCCGPSRTPPPPAWEAPEMTACADQAMLLHGLLDGELDAVNALACEAHLKTCAACNAEFLRLRAVRDQVTGPGVAYAAPVDLRARIVGATPATAGVSAPVPARGRRR